VAYVALGLAFIASFLTWATVSVGSLSVSVSGTDGDGSLTAILTIASAGLLAAARVTSTEPRRGLIIASLVAAVLALLIYLYDLIDVARVAGDNTATGSGFDLTVDASPGVGLYLGALGSLVAGGALVALLRKASSKP